MRVRVCVCAIVYVCVRVSVCVGVWNVHTHLRQTHFRPATLCHHPLSTDAFLFNLLSNASQP